MVAGIVLTLMTVLVGSFMALAASTLTKDGLASAERSDCIIPAGFDLFNPTFSTNDSNIFSKVDTTYQKSGQNTVHQARLCMMKVPVANAASSSLGQEGYHIGDDKYMQLDYSDALLDKDGNRHDLHIKISNIQVRYEYSPELGDTINQGLIWIQNNRLVFVAGCDYFYKLDGTPWVYSPPTGQGNNDVGISCKIQMWTDDDLTYNLMVRDLDAADYFPPETAWTTNYGAWSESVNLGNGFGAIHVSSDTRLSIESNGRVHGDGGDEDTDRSALVSQASLTNSESTSASFVWKACTCATNLFTRGGYTTVTKAGSGGRCYQIAGSSAEATPIALPQSNISEGDYVTGTSLGTVPKNDYVVMIVPEPRYQIASITVDGQPVNGVEIDGTRSRYVTFSSIAADHTVTALFELKPPPEPHNPQFGDLVIRKEAGDGTTIREDETFTIVVELKNENDTPVDGVEYGGYAFEDGKTEVTLHAGESKIISNIPVGYKYDIHEKEGTFEQKYAVTYTNESGTISQS